jgi:hypothetical protein
MEKNANTSTSMLEDVIFNVTEGRHSVRNGGINLE